MPAQVSFWQRMSNLFRGGASARTADGGLISGPDELPELPPHDSVDSDDLPPRASLLPWKRESAQLRDGFDRVVRTMDAMQEHFARQDDRGRQLTQSFERVADQLERIAHTQHSQDQSVKAIVDRVEGAGREAAKVSEALARMQTALGTQAEVLRSAVRHLEISQECDSQMMLSFQRFAQAIDNLCTATNAQVQNLHRLHDAQSQQNEALGTMIREQSRRFMIVLIAVTIVSLAALGGVGAMLVSTFSRST